MKGQPDTKLAIHKFTTLYKLWCCQQQSVGSNPGHGTYMCMPLSKALYHSRFIKSWEEKCTLIDQPGSLYDNKAYILMDCEVGNPVSAPGVGGKVPLVTVDLGRQKSVSVALTWKWSSLALCC